MEDPDRFVYVLFHIDTNRINSKNHLASMNQLEAWHEAGVIMMEMSLTAQREASSGGDARRSRKAMSHVFTCTEASNQEEWAEISAIEAVLFPGGARTPNERNDVDIVFNAKKYCAILVTNDGDSKRQPGGILGHREDLSKMGITVMTDADAITHVRTKIADRDRLLRERSVLDGTPLPEWVGID